MKFVLCSKQNNVIIIIQDEKPKGMVALLVFN